MRRRCGSVALILLFAASSRACADVSYSYIAEAPSYTGPLGSTVDVNLYLQETVTETGVNQTSLINRYFATSDLSKSYTGLAIVSVGVSQTGLSGGTVSQIRGPSVFTATGTYPGVQNNEGWTYNPALSYSFKAGNTAAAGGSNFSQLYQNLMDPVTGFSGNNLQVSVALSTSPSFGGFSVNNGILTDAPYDSVNDRFGSGKILIGTLHIEVGSGTTTFQVEPLAQSTLVGVQNSTFNGQSNPSAGATTPLSGSRTNTNLAVIGYKIGLSPVVNLDQFFPTRGGSAAFDSFNSINSLAPAAGPTVGSQSFIPAYDPASSVFTFAVSPAAVPEPSSLALCGLMTAAGYAAHRRRNRARQTA